MLHVVQFSAAADTETVVGEVRGMLGLPGVRTAVLYEALSPKQGEARYLVQVEADETHDPDVARRIQTNLQQYAADLWAVSHRTYKRVG